MANYLLISTLLIALVASSLAYAPPQAPTANAGPDRASFTNEPLSLDGTASTGAFDGLQADGRASMRWDFGYGGWTYENGVIAPIAYPTDGTYTVTLTVCNAAGTCASDTATVTVSPIPLGSVTTLNDTGNPLTNLTNLQAQIDSRLAEASPVTNLPAGFIWRGTLMLKRRTSTTYHTIRTANFASLPVGINRVFPSDAANMAIGEIAISSNIIDTPSTSSNPARYFNFIGIHLRKTVSTFDFTHNFVNIGHGDETSLIQLPNHIIIDRCYFDGGSTTSKTLRGLLFRANDSALVNSYIYRFKGFQLETQAALTLTGERQAFINNLLEGAAENYMSGGAAPAITGHVPTDIVVRRNHFKKDPCWFAGSACYYGVDFTVKNNFEIKIGLRFSVQGNYMENHWQEDQMYAIAITVRAQDSTAPWSNISYVDLAHNKLHKVGRGINTLTKDDLEASGLANHLLYRHNIFSGVSFYNGIFQTFFFSGAGSGDRLYLVRNTTDQNGNPLDGQGRWIGMEDTANNTNCVFIGNIGQGFIHHTLGNGQLALQASCSSTSWTFTKNGLYRGSGTNPAGNTTVALITDVKFVNLATANLRLADDSPFLTTGLGGGREGADTDAVDALTSGTVTGIWSGGAGQIYGKATLGGKVVVQ